LRYICHLVGYKHSNITFAFVCLKRISELILRTLRQLVYAIAFSAVVYVRFVSGQSIATKAIISVILTAVFKSNNSKPNFIQCVCVKTP